MPAGDTGPAPHQGARRRAVCGLGGGTVTLPTGRCALAVRERRGHRGVWGPTQDLPCSAMESASVQKFH